MKKLFFGLILMLGTWLIAFSNRETKTNACHEKCGKEVSNDGVTISDKHDYFILLPNFHFFSE